MVLLKKYNNIIPLFRLCFYVAQEKITFTVFLVFRVLILVSLGNSQNRKKYCEIDICLHILLPVI